MNRRGFVWASYVVLVGWVGALLLAAIGAGAGASAALGWTDSYQQRISLIPGTDLLEVDVAPTWEIEGGGPICEPVRVSDYDPDCYGFVLAKGEQRLDGDTVVPGDVRAVKAEFSGQLVLDADDGWEPLLVSIMVMRAIGILVIAFVLYQLWRILRSAAGGEPFAEGLVRRLRWMGGVLVGWEITEPVAWLFLSPKAFDFHGTSYGPVPFGLGPMEPGGPSVVVIVFGLLLVLLASVFKYGAHLADEQRLTV